MLWEGLERGYTSSLKHKIFTSQLHLCTLALKNNPQRDQRVIVCNKHQFGDSNRDFKNVKGTFIKGEKKIKYKSPVSFAFDP